MLQIDFKEHNRKAAEIWKAYHAGNPTRVPVTIYADTRNWIHEPNENLHGVTLSEYLKDSELMLECQVRAQDWKRHNILSDDGMGDPEDGWSITLDYQNYLEPVWFGAVLKDGIEPHAPAFLGEDDKHALFETGIPNAFSGIGGDVRDRYEWFLERIMSFRYRNLPVAHLNMPGNMTGTDFQLILDVYMMNCPKTLAYTAALKPACFAAELLNRWSGGFGRFLHPESCRVPGNSCCEKAMPWRRERHWTM